MIRQKLLADDHAVISHIPGYQPSGPVISAGEGVIRQKLLAEDQAVISHISRVGQMLTSADKGGRGKGKC